MKVLFVGGMFPQKLESDIYSNSKGAVQNAANVLQWNIIKGLQQCEKVDLTVASALFVGAWPRRYQIWNMHEGKCDGIDLIAFKNFPIYKNVSRYINVYKYCIQWIKKNESNKEQQCIIVYSAHTPFIKALYKIKKKYPFVRTHIIVPDLPEYMNLELKNNTIFNILKKIDINIQKACLSCIDSFTFLTKYMSGKFNLYHKPYVVVEGMIDSQVIERYAEEAPEVGEIRLVYTGTMNIRYGVMNLVRAMNFIKEPNVRLILCGTGDGERKILQAAKTDKRILYCGQVSRQEALNQQRRATLLVNPRSGDEEYTKYSFPSKNLEYMLHNKPVIVFKLAGVPDEYDQVLNYFRDSNPKHMAEDIMEICKLPLNKRIEIGKKTTAFALKEKNYVVQTKKILSVCET